MLDTICSFSNRARIVDTVLAQGQSTALSCAIPFEGGVNICEAIVPAFAMLFPLRFPTLPFWLARRDQHPSTVLHIIDPIE